MDVSFQDTGFRLLRRASKGSRRVHSAVVSGARLKKQVWEKLSQVPWQTVAFLTTAFALSARSWLHPVCVWRSRACQFCGSSRFRLPLVPVRPDRNTLASTSVNRCDRT